MNETKFKANNLKNKEVKIDYKADQVDNSIVLSDQKYKELIKAKDQEIDQLKVELNKKKDQLVEANKKLILYNIGNKQSSFDLEYYLDNTFTICKSNDIQNYYTSHIINPNSQTSINNLLSSSEKFIMEESRIRNISYLKKKYGFNMVKSASEVKAALCQLKKRTQRLLECKR